MHDTAYHFGRAFFDLYLAGLAPVILDVGSYNVNGSLRNVAPLHSTYVGVDLAAGPGVDLVLEDPHALPFAAGSFDAVVSTSCFEHDDMFWLTFQEMARVTKPGGYIYVNSPSNGVVHRYPSDCWRFYPDAALALARWARRQGFQIDVMEAFIAPPEQDIWADCIMIFGREAPRPAERISAGITNVVHGQIGAPTDAALEPHLFIEDRHGVQTLRTALAQAETRQKALQPNPQPQHAAAK